MAVPPGAEAPQSFADYRALLDEMTPAQQAAAIGASNYRLLKAGVVTWEDVVTPGRIRTLREVVSLEGLTIKKMVGAGVRQPIAEQAYQSVHTPAHELADQTRRELIDKITKAGLSQEAQAKELADRLARRVAVAEGPSYTTRSGIVLPGIRGSTLPGGGGTHAEDLARAIRETTITRVAMGPQREHSPARPGAGPAPPAPAGGTPARPVATGSPIADRIRESPAAEKARLLAGIGEGVARAGDEVDRLLARQRELIRSGAPDDQLRGVNAALRDAQDAYRLAANDAQARALRRIGLGPDVERAAWQHEIRDTVMPAERDSIAKARQFAEALTARGEGQSGPVAIQWRGIDPADEQRSFAVAGGKMIFLGQGSGALEAVHELGHQIEFEVRGVHAALQEFLDYRVKDEVPRSMNLLTGGTSFNASEMGRDDDFGKAFGTLGGYVGKVMFRGGTEVLSMGLEKLMEDAAGFAHADPEFAALVIGVLDGSLRHP